jgi:hypothetical protein
MIEADPRWRVRASHSSQSEFEADCVERVSKQLSEVVSHDSISLQDSEADMKPQQQQAPEATTQPKKRR